MEEKEKEITRIWSMVKEVNKRYSTPVWENHLVYDSTSETLEPLYFWVLDFLQGRGVKVEKVIDNFVASPGSGYFAELGMRATRMQEEGMKILGNVNVVIKSIINIIYDLKEFEIRMKHYQAARSQDKVQKDAAILALKQIWMDNVDIKRGRGSINMLTYDLSFTTLRDAFMVANSLEDVNAMDLNERVKRILAPRIAEFLEWWKRSEVELQKRYEIERTYLKSQVNALQLYTRWAKPYMKTAEQLRMKDMTSPNVINIFNTVVLELTLLCTQEVKVADAAYNKQLPLNFARKNFKRKYNSCVLVDFTFRAIPRRISPQEAHYVFGGRAEVDFLAFAMNDDEMLVLRDKLRKEDITDALKLVEMTTTESLEQMKGDIDYFLKEPKKEEVVQETMQNPFAALFGFRKKEKPKSPEQREEAMLKNLARGVPRDDFAEARVREVAEAEAANIAFSVFDIYKKSHDMASIPGGVDFYEYFKGAQRWKPGF